MGNLTLAFLALAWSLLAFTEFPTEMRKIFDDSIATAQQLTTAGDLRSMAQMLDIHFLAKGRYPKTEHFDRWLTATFRESNIKGLHEDAWGNRYEYFSDSSRKTFILNSLGPDKTAKTADDMTVTGP